MALTPDLIERALALQKQANDHMRGLLQVAPVGVDPYDDLESAYQRGQRAQNRLERAILQLLIAMKDAEIARDTQVKTELEAQLNTKPAN